MKRDPGILNVIVSCSDHSNDYPISNNASNKWYVGISATCLLAANWVAFQQRSTLLSHYSINRNNCSRQMLRYFFFFSFSCDFITLNGFLPRPIQGIIHICDMDIDDAVMIPSSPPAIGCFNFNRRPFWITFFWPTGEEIKGRTSNSLVNRVCCFHPYRFPFFVQYTIRPSCQGVFFTAPVQRKDVSKIAITFLMFKSLDTLIALQSFKGGI